MIAQVQKNTKNTSRIQMLLALALAAATQPAATAPAPAEEVVVVMYTVKSLVAAQPAKEEVYGTSTSMVEVEAEAVVGAQPAARQHLCGREGGGWRPACAARQHLLCGRDPGLVGPDRPVNPKLEIKMACKQYLDSRCVFFC